MEGFVWMSRLARWGAGACLADDIGLGKTVQTIAVMLDRADAGPCLVIAPTSVCPNWLAEIARFAPTLIARRMPAIGDRGALIAGLGARDVLVCSYGILHQSAEALGARSWQMLVLDEAQAIKNAETKRAQAVQGLQAGFRLALTGTPVENHLDELWSLFNFVNPGLLGSREGFQKRFARPTNETATRMHAKRCGRCCVRSCCAGPRPRCWARNISIPSRAPRLTVKFFFMANADYHKYSGLKGVAISAGSKGECPMIIAAKPRILVTGATGNVGTPLVRELLSKGFPVRAVVRSKDSRTAHLEKLGAELVVADLYDADQLTDAARGTQRAFYLPPFRPHMLQSAVAFAVAARAAKLEHVVQLSQWTSHRLHKAHMTRQTWLADQLFAMIPGVAHTVLNPGMFAHNFLRVIDFAALLAIYPVLAPKGKAAPVSNEDIARVAAVLLAEGPGLHAGKTYRPTGPALLDSREMAAIVATAVGHGVVRVNMPIWMLGKVARQQGVDPFEISSIRFYMQDMAEGTFEFEGGVTNVVEELTGTPAESFETTARRYAALPFARQTLKNRIKAFINFNLVPFYAGTKFDKWDERMAFPPATVSSLSIEDENWRREHAAQMAIHREKSCSPRVLMRAV